MTIKVNQLNCLTIVLHCAKFPLVTVQFETEGNAQKAIWIDQRSSGRKKVLQICNIGGEGVKCLSKQARVAVKQFLCDQTSISRPVLGSRLSRGSHPLVILLQEVSIVCYYELLPPAVYWWSQKTFQLPTQ